MDRTEIRRTGSLVSFVPKMPHSVIHFLHFERVIFHDGTNHDELITTPVGTMIHILV